MEMVTLVVGGSATVLCGGWVMGLKLCFGRIGGLVVLGLVCGSIICLTLLKTNPLQWLTCFQWAWRGTGRGGVGGADCGRGRSVGVSPNSQSILIRFGFVS